MNTTSRQFHDTQRALARTALLASVLVLLLGNGVGALAADDCPQPGMPALPDGASASMEEMLAGQKAVKTFQAENTEYMQCLESSFTAAKANAESPDAAVRALAQAQYSSAIDAYNAAVSAEEEVAGAFNIELREYKAANR